MVYIYEIYKPRPDQSDYSIPSSCALNICRHVGMHGTLKVYYVCLHLPIIGKFLHNTRMCKVPIVILSIKQTIPVLLPLHVCMMMS